MAGWGSANKYGVLGTLRSVAQLISYEIPIIAVALSVAILAQSLNLVKIVEAQDPVPFLFLQPLGAFLFLLAGLAEVGRTPFDIFHAESEVMGGPFIEYSGAHWAIFYLAEYINTFLVAALITILFLGGWAGPFLHPVLWFLIKVYGMILLFYWFRGTFPRLRIDQLMSLAWKVFVPLSFLNFMFTASYRFYGWPGWVLTAFGLCSLLLIFFATYKKVVSQTPDSTINLVPAREVRRAE
jgi:NADH-quinone oxidoreductase subunit H